MLTVVYATLLMYLINLISRTCAYVYTLLIDMAEVSELPHESPFPEYPLLQEQSNPPTSLEHAAFSSQRVTFSKEHSSTSKQINVTCITWSKESGDTGYIC